MASVEASVYDVKACVDCFDTIHVFLSMSSLKPMERLPFTLTFVLEGFQPGDELLLGEPGDTCSRHCLD